MCQISLGLGRDFFEQLRSSYIKHIILKKQIDCILYYLQLTKGFTMPNIDFFYDNKQTVQSLCKMFDIDKENQIKLDKSFRFKSKCKRCDYTW